MKNTIKVIGHDTINEINIGQITLHDQALPTSRLLDGSSDHGAYAEYTQPCTLPDGTNGTAVYILQNEHVQDTEGEMLEDEENYDWDSALNRIVVE